MVAHRVGRASCAPRRGRGDRPNRAGPTSPSVPNALPRLYAVIKKIARRLPCRCQNSTRGKKKTLRSRCDCYRRLKRKQLRQTRRARMTIGQPQRHDETTSRERDVELTNSGIETCHCLAVGGKCNMPTKRRDPPTHKQCRGLQSFRRLTPLPYKRRPEGLLSPWDIRARCRCWVDRISRAAAAELSRAAPAPGWWVQ